jgi:hypothetical protein
MRLKSNYPSCLITPEIEQAIDPNRNPICHIAYNRDTWVRLFQVPSEYCADEALLLCQESFDTWVAWIPGYGEVLLERSNFSV